MIFLNKEENNFINLVFDIITSLLISFKILNYSLITMTKSTEKGFLNIIFLIIAVVALTLYIIKFLKNIRKKWVVSISFLGLMLIFIVVLLYFMSISKTSLSISELLIYFVLSFFIGFNGKINISRVLTFIMLISLIAIPCFNELFVVQWYGSVNMDISYAFLPPITAAIVHVIYYFKEKKHRAIYLLLYGINAFYLSQILLYGERGTIFCILVSIALCWIITFDKNKIFEKRKLSIKLIIISAVFFFTILFYKNILSFIVEVFNINSYAINKFLDLSSVDVSNGRFTIYSTALKAFVKSPIIGNGISVFYYYTGELYPHNLIIQLLYDGGIVLFSSFVVIFIVGTREVYSTKNKNKIVSWVYFLPISVIYLLFSNNIWVVPSMWIFMGYLCSIFKKE